MSRRDTEYYSMILDKTGGLFRLAVGLMQCFASSNNDTDFTPLVNNLGLYFQIRDDLINLSDPSYFKSKSFCEDLTEGKFSYPIIHCIKSGDDNDTRLISILKQRTEDTDLKKYAQGLMKDTGSLKHTRDKCKELMAEIFTQIDELGGNAPLKKILEMLDVQVEGLADVVGESNSEKQKLDST
jgi:geranylgeranyl diphosphate synthase type 3